MNDYVERGEAIPKHVVWTKYGAKKPFPKGALFAIVGIVLMIQSLWMLCDAKKRGLNHWMWGAIGLINMPASFIAYVLVTKRKFKGIKCCKIDN